MRTRVRLTPLIYFGPIAFVPMVIIGALLDLFVFKSSNGICTILLTSIGLAFYLLSFIMSILVLKTEKKAQKRAYEIMKADLLRCIPSNDYPCRTSNRIRCDRA